MRFLVGFYPYNLVQRKFAMREWVVVSNQGIRDRLKRSEGKKQDFEGGSYMG